MCRFSGLVALAVGLLLPVMAAAQWSGNVAMEGRWFANDGFPCQTSGDVSVSFQPEYRRQWKNGDRGFTFVPFARLDNNDDRRTHADIRELMFLGVEGDWELRAGIGRVFWGVTESQHLVNIINQIDYVEDFFGEVTLGQPMVRLTRVMDTGALDLFVLPGFRERTFPGPKGRFRPALVVDVDNPQYESDRQEYHVDWAARWSQYIGNIDYGVYWFSGTDREPQLLPGVDGGEPMPIPYYAQISQVGLDAQYTGEAWLWKLEVIHRDYRDDRWQDFSAAVGGFEYTFVGLMDSVADLGALVEYHWDSQGSDAQRVLQNDVFLGARLTLNDVAGSELLAGFFWDLDFQTPSLRVEASRRFGDDFKASLEAQWFGAAPPEDPLAFFQHDDYIGLEIARYF